MLLEVLKLFIITSHIACVRNRSEWSTISHFK